MKIQVSAKMLLVMAIVLLATNIVVMLGMYGANPAHAQGRTCVGVAASPSFVVRAWSDGTCESRFVNNIGEGSRSDPWKPY